VLSHAFVRDAFLGGTGIAVASGAVGWFLVLRAQVFAADALSHVAFAGTLAALAAGLDARLGLFAATVVVGFTLGLLGNRGHADDVVIGTVFTWVLGLGVLFLSIYVTSASAGNGGASQAALFGSIFALGAGAARTALVVGLASATAVVLVARPLLTATLDPEIAAARSIPVRALGVGFLVLVGVVAAEASQAVGALMLLGLVAAPAGAALRLTDRPARGVGLSVLFALVSVWVGVAVAYTFGHVPPTFGIVGTATTIYAAAWVAAARRRDRASIELRP
jgi:zinc/manganese transport system permease protein